MAIYRNVSMTFWTDSKVVDEFTADDRYFYLYLFTNPHTNLCGCYEISVRQMSYETGLSAAKVRTLIKRMSDVHGVIRYCNETKELILVNWHKYNWTESEKFRKPLLKEINNIKCEAFKSYLLDVFKGENPYAIDTVSIPYSYGSDTTVSVSVSDTVSDTVSITDTDTDVNEIVNYLNEMCGTAYKPGTRKTKDQINARLKEGFTVDDFKTVIYKKAKQWMNDPKMCKYLRPETLFSTKFESYLNEKTAPNLFERWDSL